MGNKCLNQNNIERSIVFNNEQFNANKDQIYKEREQQQEDLFNLSIKTIGQSHIQQNDTIYEGKLLDGKKQGHGTLIFDDGFVLEADFDNDMIVGQVVYKNADNYVYKGNWKDGNPHGKGIEKLRNGSYYEGEFKNGLKHGKGFYQWEDLSTYDGEWANNNINGYVVQKGNLCLAQWSQILRKLERQFKTWIWRNVLSKRV